MIGGRCRFLTSVWCPWWRHFDDDDVGDEGPELEPVLLVTGMGGAILNARDKKSGSSLRVWVRIFLANVEFQKYLWSLYNPDTGYVESLDQDREIVVPDDDYGLYGIDILDPSWWVTLFHVTDVYHFHDMINMLVGSGYTKGTTLFGFGYDFRQSNRIDKAMDGLKKKIETAYKASEGKRVNIISHSMGGLLVRCFMSLHNDVFAKYVNKWICIACPFQGAPGCISDSLLTGLQFVYGFESFFFISRWNLHQLVVECPSMYEMLPNPGFEWKRKPKIFVRRKQTEGEEGVKMEEYDCNACLSLFEEALRDNKLTYNGKFIPVPFNMSILNWSIDTRKVLDSAKLPKSVSFYNIYGTSIDSPFDVCYGSEDSPIGDLSEICHVMPEYSYVDGDGTVPSESAKTDGFEATARVAVKGSHRGLLSDDRVLELLKQWLGVGEQKNGTLSTSKVMEIPIPLQFTREDI